jgi:hypothetical protein
MLTDVSIFLDALKPLLESKATPQPRVEIIPKATMYCCGADCLKQRRMGIKLVKSNGVLMRHWSSGKLLRTSDSKPDLKMFDGPGVARLTCEHCKAVYTALLYWRGLDLTLAIFPAQAGSLSTPRTPEYIAAYVDDAFLCMSIRAYGAALAAFRAALENLLYEQGFMHGMLGDKIADLEQALLDGTAPPWAAEIADSEVLRLIKDIGNIIVHPKNVSNLIAFDGSALQHVHDVFAFLLFEVYERQHVEASAVNELRQMADRLG